MGLLLVLILGLHLHRCADFDFARWAHHNDVRGNFEDTADNQPIDSGYHGLGAPTTDGSRVGPLASGRRYPPRARGLVGYRARDRQRQPSFVARQVVF